MFKKSTSYFFLALALLIGVGIALMRPVPEFEYDFEQFFPQDDEDLDFYEGFKQRFENDNDYLLLAIGNPEGPWLNQGFLEKASSLQNQIADIQRVDTVISVLNAQKPLIGVFGVSYQPVLSWESAKSLASFSDDLDFYRSGLVSADGESFLMLVKNQQNISKEDGDLVYTQIKKAFQDNAIEPLAVAGKIQAQGDFVKLMQSEFSLFLGISFVLILIVLALIYRSWSGVLIPIFILSIGVAWAFALIILGGRSLDVMSVMQPTIFLIVGMSALIHFFTHLAKRLRAKEKELVIEEVFKELFVPVGLTILTTGLGFISLYFTTIPALKSFGLSTGLGIFVIFIAIILITPGLLHFFPVTLGVTRRPPKKTILLAIFQRVLENRKGIAYGFLGISVLFLLLASQVKINGFLLDSLPKDHPIQADLNFFDSQYGGSNPLEIQVKSLGEEATLFELETLKEIEKIEKELVRLFGERRFISPVSLVKTLNQAQNQGSLNAYSLPSEGQFQRLRRFLPRVVRQVGDGYLTDDLKTARISGRLPDLGSFEMERKRKEFFQFLAENIDPEVLEVRWTGTSFLIDQGHQSVTWQMVRGLGVAFFLVGLIAGILFRSWRISLILLVPNLFPLIMMAGFMFLTGIEFKLSTAILFSVAFGIAVDDSIHFMTRLKLELDQGKSLLYAIKRTFLETGFAIVLTTLVLVSGFAVLTFSQFEVTYFTGVLISLSLIFALLADLILLPVLLLPMKRVWEEKNHSKLKDAETG
ncbi:efflux RND transporter permease subunit [Algoriphagus sediminis]|uniref:Efflux RND transporter permease subunit n=1 Tax=Algoriphagus sediminis TaxID=3057113 RepID=A0ABT7YE17_9BACT|nr:efflux RND transporter permease subunit [Algoriphagus sediminis]MDN3204770.1 efflux RND transporter permease subunit [Algoriphagus sediminis]